MSFNWQQLVNITYPHLILLVGAFIALVTSVLRTPNGLRVSAAVSLMTYLASAAGFCYLWRGGISDSIAFLTIDPFSNLLGLLISLIGLITVIFSYSYWKNQSEEIPEVFSLLLFSSLGMTLMVSTSHLLTFVLALETMSLCLYVLVGIRRPDPKSSEAAFKYFLLGSVAAAFLLMGVAFLYGASGSLDLSLMQNITNSLFLKVGVILILLGFVFKIAAAPLHFWAPDVYDGAPAPITGFMAAGVKVAALGALIRVLQTLITWDLLTLIPLFTGVAIATMVVGNLTALRQKSLKRIMAYSSIAHAGYLLLGLVSCLKNENFSAQTLSPILFYLMAYSLLTLGAFVVLTNLSSSEKEIGNLEDLNGLAKHRPYLAAALSIFLISLAGIPPSAGFFAKYYLFSQAIRLELFALAVVGIVTSAVSLYYYLAPVVRMYFYDSEKKIEGLSLQIPVRILLIVLIVGVFYLGILPGQVLQITKKTALTPPPQSSAQMDSKTRMP